MFNLLTQNNTKTNKSVASGYKTYILHLSPSTMAGVGDMCPKASEGCRIACLNTSGHGGMIKADGTSKVQSARKRRTELYANDRELFMLQLYVDIKKAVSAAESMGLTPVIRLNGTSDIVFESIPVLHYANIFEAFPLIQFYDYTKIVGRYKKCSKIANYHLTFSRSESNQKDVDRALSLGMPIAVVFDKLPEYYMGAPVFDGDNDDMRFNDPSNHIIGLSAKGRAKKDESGFVVRNVGRIL